MQPHKYEWICEPFHSIQILFAHNHRLEGKIYSKTLGESPGVSPCL